MARSRNTKIRNIKTIRNDKHDKSKMTKESRIETTSMTRITTSKQLYEITMFNLQPSPI